MWNYSQSTGDLSDGGGFIVATGYSGHGPGLDNPAMQAVADVGPIPVGFYSLGAPIDHPKLGPFAIPLIPHDGNEMFGRSGFYCHGDDIHHVGEEIASHGCIVLPPDARREMWNSGDHVLKVVA